MAFVKKLVMHGFKSFGQKTEILFDKGINVIVGPNGSGKSNVSDALCFVLGRLSAKSMRAAQAKNLIFMGSKYVKPSKEASVELIFDNSDRAFGLERDEINLVRTVKRNGQSIYKINGETKTRGEMLEVLAQAGIDPYGFNLVLQGQIQSIVKMHPEERRKIIEEVAGISIYESRKEKSLHELEKTEEKLKEISAILRERTAYLKNLDKERQQALKFKELEMTIKRCRASILRKREDEKQKEVKNINKSIEEKEAIRQKKKREFDEMQEEIKGLTEKIGQINKQVQQSTGVEQDGLRNQIANLKADIEGLRVRKENFEHRKMEIERRIEEFNKSLPAMQEEIEQLRKKSPIMARKAQELKVKKEVLAKLEEERKQVLALKSELNSLRERIKDKERQIARITGESENNLRNLEDYSKNLRYKDEGECKHSLELIKQSVGDLRARINSFNQKELELVKLTSIAELEIEKAQSNKEKVEKLDICPLCQTKITAEHIKHVRDEADARIVSSKESLSKTKHELDEIRAERKQALESIREFEDKRSSSEMELIRHRTIHDKKEYLKKLVSDEAIAKKELQVLEERRKSLELKTLDSSELEEKYYSTMLEIEEISSRSEENVGDALGYKEREIEKTKSVIKLSKADVDELNKDVKEISNVLKEKTELLAKKEVQAQDLQAKFKKLFEERDKLQQDVQDKGFETNEKQDEARQIEDQINLLRIGKAKLDAEIEVILGELNEFSDVESIQASMQVLEERLIKTKEALQQIGSINMRALEMYEDMKKEYDIVQEKVNLLEKEKSDILMIIAEIDKKKKTSFMKTFRAINELFTSNFAQLYSKGVAYLEIDNKEDIFAGGISIVVKLAKGKYFDVTSLSGGEQTLVALSLLFSIQEHKPYHFYVFDEIDAALDKRNSERLSGLLNQYMKSGQYIVITHNDAIIMNSNLLYGVSMHDGISKVLSLKVKES